MDLDNLEKALENISLKIEQVHSVADYCITNNVNSQFEITKLIEKYFQQHKNPQNKTAIFLIVSQIFFLANIKKLKNFFKQLSPKICPFIEQLTPEIIDNLQLSGYVVGAIQKWTIEQFFSQTFIQRIKESAKTLIVRLAEQKADGGKHQKFTKYKKTFLMELMDLRTFAPVSSLYDTHVQMTDLNNKLNNFQQAYNKLDFQQSNEDTLKRAGEMQRAIEDYRQRLEEVIKGYHVGFKMLADECKKDFAKLERQGD